MTAKEYLKQPIDLNRLINAKQTELYKLRLDATGLSSPVLGDKVCASATDSSMATVDKIVDMQTTINAEIDRLIDIKAEIRNKIDRCYNPQYISVLTELYINGKTLEGLAEEWEVSYPTVCNLKGEALEVFRKENGMQ